MELAAQLAGLQEGWASRRTTRQASAPGRPSDRGSTGGTPQLSRQISGMMSVTGPGAHSRSGAAGPPCRYPTPLSSDASAPSALPVPLSSCLQIRTRHAKHWRGNHTFAAP
jgi:hypothetical protein